VAPDNDLFREPRSLPLAVLIRQQYLGCLRSRGFLRAIRLLIIFAVPSLKNAQGI